MSATKVFLTSNGMVCPVGLSAPAACAAMRADLSGFEELPYIDNDGDPILGAWVPGIPISDRSSERLSKMLAMSVSECIANAPWLRLDEVPLLVGIAEPDRPGGLRIQQSGTFFEDIGRRLEKRFHSAHSHVFASGHTAAFHALSEARKLIGEGMVSACLVAAVDSYINASSLSWLSDSFRLKTALNSDGVIPGEAAACILVENKPRMGTTAIEISGIGFGHEPASILTDDPPLHAQGFVEASRAALGECGLGLHDIDFRISDVAGEGYAFRELTLAMQKLLRVRKEEFPLWHVADAIGDTGAAAGVGQMVMLMEAFRKGYAPGRRAIVYSSAVGGDRAVGIVQSRVG